MKKYKSIIATAIVVSLLGGCYLNDFENIDKVTVEPISPSFGFPLINSSISIADLLGAVDSSDFVEVRDDLIFLKFSQSMGFDVDVNAFRVPDKDFTSVLPILPSASSYEFYYPDYTTIENESEIKSIELKAGTLVVEFERDYLGDDVDVRLVLRSLSNPQNPDSVEFVPDWSANPYRSVHSLDLTDAVLTLSGEDPDSPGSMMYNTFFYAIEVQSTGATIGQLTTNVNFSSIDFKRFTGLIRQGIDLPAQEIELDAFSLIADGKLYLSNPTLKLGIGTSYGAPGSIEISEFIFAKQNNELFLENVPNPPDNTFLIGEAKKNYLPVATQTQPWVEQSYVLSGENSNLDEVLPFAPSKVSVKGKYQLGDYLGTFDDLHNFFVLDTSSLKMNFDIEIPLEGSIEGLTFEYEMFDFSFPDIDSIFVSDSDSDIAINIEEFDYTVELLMKTTNEIPLTFGLQVAFSEQGNVVDSLFNNVMAENIILSPNVDGQGNPTEASEKLTSVKLSKDKYSRIAKADKLRLLLHLDTGTNEQREVLFKASQKLGIQISIKFVLEISPGV